MIRGKSVACPYGLPIPLGCKTAGSCISMMNPSDDEGDIESNKEILLACDAKSKCPNNDLLIDPGNGVSPSVDCKFDPMTSARPAGNVGLDGSPLYPGFYVGDINSPLIGGPSGYMSDDNNNFLYFGELFTDLIKGLI